MLESEGPSPSNVGKRDVTAILMKLISDQAVMTLVNYLQ